MMKEKRIFYRQIESEKRKLVKELILESVKKRKQQIEFFEDMFIRPQKGLLVIADGVLHNRYPIEFYIDANRNFTEYLDKFLGAYNKKVKK